MRTVGLNIDRYQAHELYEKYRKHGGRGPEDVEIQNAAYQLSKGKTVIRALESIRQAGLGPDNLPKLTIARANAKASYVTLEGPGSARFGDMQWPRHQRDSIKMPAGTFPDGPWRRGVATLPLIPPDVRPHKDKLDNYHILWEAEWRPFPPGDPYLLRRIGKSDLWIVLAAWDLTEVEKGAMATRIAVPPN